MEKAASILLIRISLILYLIFFFNSQFSLLKDSINRELIMTTKTLSLEEKISITRLKQDDLGGLETLVNLYQVKAVYAAYLIVQDLKLAEDIVQDSFLKAAAKINQFDTQRPFGAWFFRIVINTSIKTIERQKRFIPLTTEEYENIQPVIKWMLDPDPRPDQVVETEEMRQMVWKALMTLPPEQRAAIIMRHFLEMNVTEITQELNRPLTTIRWWLRDAKLRLREYLRSYWKSDNPEDNER